MIHWKLYTKYRCKFCKGSFVIVLGNGGFKRYVPIEVKEWENETIFDKTKHKSHFLICEKLTQEWKRIKDDIELGIKEQEKQEMKELLK